MIDDIQDLSEYLTFKDEAGHVVIQVALLATVYFENGHTREMRDGIARCCEEYLRLCGPHIRWVLAPDAHDLRPFASSQFSSPQSWIPQTGEGTDLEVIYDGARYKKGASAFMLEAMAHPKRRVGELAYFRVAFPLTFFFDKEGSFHEFVLGVCRALKPSSGYGGIGVIESPYPEIGMYFEPFAYQMAQRFPGLEVDYPTSHTSPLEHGIKGVNWLTILGDRWLAKLGGEGALRADLTALDSRFNVHTFDKGVMIQAGARPQLGDTERDIWPELYVKLAKKLKPIRVVKHGSLHFAPPLNELRGTPRFDDDSSQAWLRRFEDR